MLLKNKVLGIFVLLAWGFVIAGCESSGGVKDEGANAGAPVDDANTVIGEASTSAASAGDASSWTTSSLENPDSPLYKKTVYFNYDQSTILPEYQRILRNHAEFLSANPDLHVTIEGHTDERGTREYNIALGENRANTVRRFLENQGVAPNQLSTISYGEEQPVAFGDDETAWAQNRRAVLAY